MNFAENLQKIRKEKHLSQEKLAEILNVSRQAVSKWEQGTGYPEVETLLLLSRKLNVSLDGLMASEIAKEPALGNNLVTGNIVITSPNENVIATCYKVISTGKFKGGKRSPKYALMGVSRGGASFWGEPTTFLGWYESEEKIAKEIREIQSAIAKGTPTYELKYHAKVERHWLHMKIVDSQNL